MALCKLCLTPMRYEIEEAFKKGVPRKFIFNKFSPLMDYKGKYTSFFILLYRHMKHAKRKIFDPIEQEKKRSSLLNVQLDELIQRITNIIGGKSDAELLKDTKLRDVFMGQRVLLERAKLQLQQDALELTMAKLFGPQLEGVVEFVEGKEEDGHPELPEGVCVEPEDTSRSDTVCPDDTGDRTASGAGEVDTEVRQEDKHPKTGKPLGKESGTGD